MLRIDKLRLYLQLAGIVETLSPSSFAPSFFNDFALI